MLMPNIPVYSGELFTWSGNEGTAEASDLCSEYGCFARISDDAPHEGFYIRSHRTGNQVLFTLAEEEYFCDDIEVWHFVSHGGQYKVRVFND
jgi:hypothetical protein